MGIGVFAVDLQGLPEVLLPLRDLPLPHQLGPNVVHRDMVAGVHLQRLAVILQGGGDVVLEFGEDVAHHEQGVAVVGVPAQCVDQGVDRTVLVAFIREYLSENAVVFRDGGIPFDQPL